MSASVLINKNSLFRGTFSSRLRSPPECCGSNRDVIRVVSLWCFPLSFLSWLVWMICCMIILGILPSQCTSYIKWLAIFLYKLVLCSLTVCGSGRIGHCLSRLFPYPETKRNPGGVYSSSCCCSLSGWTEHGNKREYYSACPEFLQLIFMR